MAAGIERQLARADLSEQTRAALVRAQTALWQAIEGGGEIRQSELWSWEHDAPAGYRVVPFGQGAAHHSESNAAQLWSTVYLAVQPPEP